MPAARPIKSDEIAAPETSQYRSNVALRGMYGPNDAQELRRWNRPSAAVPPKDSLGLRSGPVLVDRPAVRYLWELM